jgi:ammonia channel protein AmtB
MKLRVYLVFAVFIASCQYAIPSRWVWNSAGWLYALGIHDLAGCLPIHIVGGLVGLWSTWWMGPRLGTFTKDEHGNNVYWPTRSSPTQVCYGTFLLLTGWLAFNSGSVLGVSNGLVFSGALAAVNTIIGAAGGSLGGFIYTSIESNNKLVDIVEICSGLIGGLVSITAACDIIQPWEALLAGIIGGIIANWINVLLVRLRIDDPVGVVGVHLMCGIWGGLVPGLFGSGKGLFRTGDGTQLAVQALGIVAMIAWSSVTALLFLFVADISVGLRVPAHHERVGLDQVEHGMVLVRLEDLEDSESDMSGSENGSFFGSSRLAQFDMDAPDDAHARKAASTAADGGDQASVQSHGDEKEQAYDDADRPPVEEEQETQPTLLGRRSGSLMRTMSSFMGKSASFRRKIAPYSSHSVRGLGQTLPSKQQSTKKGASHGDMKASQATAATSSAPPGIVNPVRPPAFLMATTPAPAGDVKGLQHRSTHKRHHRGQRASRRGLGVEEFHGLRQRRHLDDIPDGSKVATMTLARNGFPADPMDRAIASIAGPSTAAEWHSEGKPAGGARDPETEARRAGQGAQRKRDSRSRSRQARRSSVERVAVHELYVAPAHAANPQGLMAAMKEGQKAAKESRAIERAQSKSPSQTAATSLSADKVTTAGSTDSRPPK